MGVGFGLLGPLAAWDADGTSIPLGAPRHREVLGRLLIARGRVVPVGRLVADLWEDRTPTGAVGAVRTFVAALRRALEPGRPPRQPSRLLVTDGPGYALRAGREAVDAWRFEDTVARAAEAAPHAAVALWDEALAWWRGPVLADFPAAAWTAAERARLEALRLDAVEQRADALLATGAARAAVADLRAHVAAHPGREDGWVLLATALDRAGRRGEALEALDQAHAALTGKGGGRGTGGALARTKAHILSGTAGSAAEPAGVTDSVWDRAAASWDRSVPARSRARLHATAGLLRDLAVTGPDGLEEAGRHRRDLVAAAETTGDTDLAARIIGSYDVPAVWTRADDPEGAAGLVRAAARAAARLGPDGPAALRARLLSVVAVESRGDATADAPLPRAADAPATEPWRLRAERAAEEAVRLARRLGDPALLAFALNGAFMQSFTDCGSASRRDALGGELTRLAVEHQLPGHEVLGRIVRLQALAGLGDHAEADAEAEEIDRLAQRNERPLAAVFTAWYRALRTSETEGWPAARPQYAQVLAETAGCAMPGLTRGAAVLVALAPVMQSDALPDPGDFAHLDPGPYRPWLNPLLLAASGATEEARQALTNVPRPPHDLLQEALWCVLARAAASVGHLPVLRRAREELAPAEAESAGAGSGLVSFGPVTRHLAAADAALGVHSPSPTGSADGDA
ncbi:BTAD domain-containing putative transcriptional regulator [Streptomyces sp. CB03911]|uniref:BTAD domain-containing putative transcriptional regulator n=1 Tax=Streptomyces sp. CB03911 TaxID=1804758 RepID=UPI00093CF2FC|nr:BTAD domain-containing putative transcriptional regulator [Streptomyces sp. CB03911]OKI20365.1 SARP family transcriptional regulator [Streptomyces sp. CB03911]